jgi:nitronate monooxygenase
MWPKTRVAETLNIKYPIIQAPMAGGYTTPELISAVSNAGALGSLGAGYMSPEEISENIQRTKILLTGDQMFAVNLFVPTSYKVDAEKIKQTNEWMKKYRDELHIPEHEPIQQYRYDFDKQMEVILDHHVPIFSFTFGLLEKRWMKKLKQKKVRIIGTATRPDEAHLLEQQGVDLIVVQGLEAGGHRASFLSQDPLLSTIELLPQIIKHVEPPVIAAGGFMNAEDLYAALRLRADGLQMGTAFLTCDEAKIIPEHKQAILTMKPGETVLTRVFSGRPSRVIKNRFVEEMSEYEDNLSDYPVHAMESRDIQRAAKSQHKTDLMPLFCGGYGYLAQTKPAAMLIKELVEKLEEML